eukprot:1160206-Pelagomonas_calceolata.AAC.6
MLLACTYLCSVPHLQDGTGMEGLPYAAAPAGVLQRQGVLPSGGCEDALLSALVVAITHLPCKRMPVCCWGCQHVSLSALCMLHQVSGAYKRCADVMLHCAFAFSRYSTKGAFSRLSTRKAFSRSST